MDAVGPVDDSPKNRNNGRGWREYLCRKSLAGRRKPATFVSSKLNRIDQGHFGQVGGQQFGEALLKAAFTVFSGHSSGAV